MVFYHGLSNNNRECNSFSFNMPSTKKQLKKLKKRIKKLEQQELRQQQAIAAALEANSQLLLALKKISADTTHELMAPLEPEPRSTKENRRSGQVIPIQAPIPVKAVTADTDTATNPATRPWKSRPCKGCAALKGGLCKCAIKKQAA